MCLLTDTRTAETTLPEAVAGSTKIIMWMKNQTTVVLPRSVSVKVNEKYEKCLFEMRSETVQDLLLHS
jgi:hypothetical protein